MKFEDLSESDQKEYQMLSDYCKFLSQQKFKTTITIEMPVFFGIVKTISDIDDEIFLEGIWQDGTNGNIIYNHKIGLPSDLEEKVDKAWQDQIDDCISRIGAWETKTGMEFNGYY
ncbi:hypothetical protein UFOVP1290_264 [uncultured Caudovirales phage]|uniref:Uncharacterized protein n=1 Tax=uncultured Caudovirales phage TaxID=2100421 RepID=A0A6J5RXK2_9CAUD|nr:hypothetical protein UFOVP1290_264 [uncultured Caudovirales phage]